ncbi:hypothetical protein NliqN6_5993 [Naganishia liquefaciens]|uniref:Bud22 domain-containing protein n=1 Tax=Naganishia liquefaciens TaxID=104408 RepID=A0A8H3YJJ9_9TREE|nr:hypothetical protein NliqN6_5993 [Naganishia liquefaciens]
MDITEPTAKRKRSGKAREEAKARAIAKAEEAAKEAERAERAGEDEKASDAGEDGEGEDKDEKEEEDPSKRIPDIELIRKRIPQALKSLHPILKRSKASETQRIIKKIKFLRTKSQEGQTAELADLEGQLEALKKLDLHATIPPLLHLKLRKHPSLRPLLPLPETLFPEPFPSTQTDASTPEGKAQNRILSAKGTGELVNGVVAWCIGLEGGKLKTQASKTKAKVAEKKPAATESRRSELKPKPITPKEMAADAEDVDDLAAQDAAADAAGWESGSINSDGAEDENRYPLMSDAESSDSDAVSFSEPPAKRTRTLASSISPPPKASKKGPAGSSSLFLPTLASGFTMGSYDSDPDEDERRDKKSGKGGLIQSVRKNRRGQAERRKIWEQKYGKGANHVKKAEAEAARAERDAKFLASQMGGSAAKPKWGDKTRRGGEKPSPVGGANVRDSGWQRGPARAGAAAVPAAAAAPEQVKPAPKPATTVTGTEHPSWIAAKLRKEREMAGLGRPGAGAAKPKKIVFD